jgi:UDPglucose 6-dehydrogenase
VVSAPFESQSVAQAGEVAVIGAGYVGLTSAVCLAHLGHRVVCADVDAYKVAELAAGRPTHHEPGIDGLLRAGLDAGNLRFVLGAAEAVADADVVLLCLPTPMGADGRPDLTALTGVATAIGPQLLPGAVVVDKSTVPVGTTRVVADCLGRGDVAVVANPEFLREGQAVHDFLHPDRVVIGGEDRDATARVAALYESLGCPVLVTDAVSAEITKYAANAFLVTKLSFANSVAAVCEALGGDAHDVLRGVGYDHRVGHAHLRPGPGWGGSCFPKDVQALLHLAHDAGEPFHLLQAVLDANESHFDRVAERVLTLAA